MVEVRNITLSQIVSLQSQGYEDLSGCDAAKANGDAFRVMVRRKDGEPDDIAIVCPTFLRGTMRFQSAGSISY